MATEMLGWVKDNLPVLTVTIPALWIAIQFILNRRSEAKRQQFETYHLLIQRLVEREQAGQPLKLDRQIAVIFELRSLTHYHPVTLRIFKGLKVSWKDYGPQDEPEKTARLHEELDLAIADIQKRADAGLIGRLRLALGRALAP
jgi:hypothetical protein